MVSKSPTPFDAYEFEDKEEASLIFNDLQIMYLQTELSAIAMQKIDMAVPDDPNALDIYLRKQEYLRGQMDILKGILAANSSLIQSVIETLSQTSGKPTTNQE